MGEIVLCTKEVNKKTRAAAFALLVDLARAMHEAVPIPLPPIGPVDSAMGASASKVGSWSCTAHMLACQDLTLEQVFLYEEATPIDWARAGPTSQSASSRDCSVARTSDCAVLVAHPVFLAHLIALSGPASQALANKPGTRPPSSIPAFWPHAGEEAAQVQGGLPTLMAMVLGGLVATTPHMVSACVMALARLLFEFAGLLEQAAPRLLETVLMLLRSKSREVIKSVIGFCKVGVGCCKLNTISPSFTNPTVQGAQMTRLLPMRLVRAPLRPMDC